MFKLFLYRRCVIIVRNIYIICIPTGIVKESDMHWHCVRSCPQCRCDFDDILQEEKVEINSTQLFSSSEAVQTVNVNKYNYKTQEYLKKLKLI